MTHAERIVIAAFSCLFTVPLAVAAETGASPDAEKILSAAPNSASYGRHLLHLTEEPHMAGTERRSRTRGIRA